MRRIHVEGGGGGGGGHLPRSHPVTSMLLHCVLLVCLNTSGSTEASRHSCSARGHQETLTTTFHHNISLILIPVMLLFLISDGIRKVIRGHPKATWMSGPRCTATQIIIRFTKKIKNTSISSFLCFLCSFCAEKSNLSHVLLHPRQYIRVNVIKEQILN